MPEAEEALFKKVHKQLRREQLDSELIAPEHSTGITLFNKTKHWIIILLLLKITWTIFGSFYSYIDISKSKLIQE